MITLNLFATTDLRRDDGVEVRDFLTQLRPLALLVYLAAAGPRAGTFHRKDTLIGLFWPEANQEQARINLRGLVHTIRQALGEEIIESRGDEELRIAPDLVWCDVVEFESLIARGHYARADELYRGELLPGFYLPRAPVPEFDQWLSMRRGQLAEAAADNAWKLAAMFDGGEQMTDAVRFARRAARLAIHDERRLRRALDLLVRAGNSAMAIMLYDELCERMHALGARPSPETRKLIEDIRRR